MDLEERTIILTTTHPNLKLPSSRYLALHALACEIAHMSGAAEYLEDIQRDAEDIRVLASDGSTADILSAVLSLVSPVTTLADAPSWYSGSQR